MVSILYLYYNQPLALKHLEDIGYKDYPARTIIVDDGIKTPLDCIWAEIYRIEQDIPWNQPAANNLGFSKIKDDETVLRMDIDHWIELKDLLILPKVKENTIIKFKRLRHDPDGTTKELQAANNIYLTKASTIKTIGGYNEDFCGSYGYDDKELLYRLSLNRCHVLIHDSIFIHVCAESSTKNLSRDTSRNKKLFESIKQNQSKT